jgi:hypothetical protein
LARPTAAEVQSELNDDVGWQRHSEKGEVTLYTKPIPALDKSAWKGTLVLPSDADPTRVFAAICDIDNHENFSDSLEDSAVVRRVNGVMEYYQIMKPPPLIPMSTRFWVSLSAIENDVGGEAGHLRRAWDSAGPDELQDIRASVLERFPRAIEVLTHGSWELDPQPDGTSLLIYRTVADPGGAIPEGLANSLSGRTLPDNMRRFVNAGRN